MMATRFSKGATRSSASRGAMNPKVKETNKTQSHSGRAGAAISPSRVLARSRQPVRPCTHPNVRVAITHVRCAARQVQPNMILCIGSVFSRAARANRNNGCLHRLGLSAAQRQADARFRTNVFLSFRWGGRGGLGGSTGYDCRGRLPQIPPAQ